MYEKSQIEQFAFTTKVLMFKMFSMKNNVKMYRFKFVFMQHGENTIKRRPFWRPSWILAAMLILSLGSGLISVRIHLSNLHA